MEEPEFNPTHVVYQEFVGPDGYATTKVPLKAIRFIDKPALEKRIFGGEDTERYAHYADMVRNGHYANGVPIVYRGPRGTMLASDLRYSDVAIHAELNTRLHAGVPRNTVHPMLSVKIIEIDSLEDILAKRAKYLEDRK